MTTQIADGPLAIEALSPEELALIHGGDNIGAPYLFAGAVTGLYQKLGLPGGAYLAPIESWQPPNIQGAKFQAGFQDPIGTLDFLRSQLAPPPQPPMPMMGP